MERTERLLIVEDEDDWCAIYERAAKRVGIANIEVAHSRVEAEDRLERMDFAVAFVDIGLDVSDDRNVDGLRVMSKIRELGDRTSIIVVTGRSGRDVLPITRDAIKKYGAFDTVGKVPIEPRDIVMLLRGGVDAYKDAILGARPTRVYEVLRGDLRGWDWDDRMLRATHPTGGLSTLYGFLEALFGQFLPVLPREIGRAVRLHDEARVAFGEYWSRGVGKAVVVCFGGEREMETVVRDARVSRRLFSGSEEVGDILNEHSVGNICGVVFELPRQVRTDFGAADAD